MEHYEAGVQKAYMDLCGCADWEDAKSIMERVLGKKIPAPNDPCFCSSEMKFKKCHHSKVTGDLLKIGREQIESDLTYICEHNPYNFFISEVDQTSVCKRLLSDKPKKIVAFMLY